jgi:hypothetical protein
MTDIETIVDADGAMIAAWLVFVVGGDDKRAVFEAAAAGHNDLSIARLLRAARQRVTCFT